LQVEAKVKVEKIILSLDFNLNLNLNVAENLVKWTWVNPAEGGSSGRTFNAISAYVSDPRCSSPLVKSTHPFNMSTQPPFEALKSGLPMAIYVTVK